MNNYLSLYIFFIILVLSIIIFYIIIRKYKKEFINNSNITKSRLEFFLDFFEFVPNFFISLGILGTFLGITIGLNGLVFDTAEHLKNNISKLLSSMELAFISSLFGIICSLISKWLINPFYFKITDKINQIEDEQHYQLIVSIKNIKEEISFLSQSSFSEVAQNLNNGLSNFVENLTQNTSPIIENFLINFSKINSILENSIKTIDDSFLLIRQYKDSVEDNQKKLKEQFNEITNLSENIKSFTNDLQNTLKSNIELITKQENIVQNFYDKIESTNSIIDKYTILAEKTTNLIESSSNTISILSNKVDNFIDNLNEIAINYPNILKINLNNSFSDLDSHISNIISSFRTISNNISESIEIFNLSLQQLKELKNNLISESQLEEKQLEKEGE